MSERCWAWIEGEWRRAERVPAGDDHANGLTCVVVSHGYRAGEGWAVPRDYVKPSRFGDVPPPVPPDKQRRVYELAPGPIGVGERVRIADVTPRYGRVEGLSADDTRALVIFEGAPRSEGLWLRVDKLERVRDAGPVELPPAP